MEKDYQQLWEAVINALGEAKTRALAEIVVDREGRVFVSGLDHEAAKLCFEILDSVGCNLHLPPSTASDSLVRASQSTP